MTKEEIRFKQRITIDQLNELTDKQKDNLRNWWQPEEGDFIYAGIETDTAREQIETIVLNVNGIWLIDEENAYLKEKCLPLLSIGQMIQLIRDKEAYNIHGDYLIWWKYVCDTLWYEVKKVL